MYIQRSFLPNFSGIWNSINLLICSILGDIPRDDPEPAGGSAEVVNDPGTPSVPPESTFVKLAPSKNRYTILKDEL